MLMEKILIIGASGQIGTELVMELRKMYGNHMIIASDIKESSQEVMSSGPFESLDIMNEELLRKIVKKKINMNILIIDMNNYYKF